MFLFEIIIFIWNSHRAAFCEVAEAPCSYVRSTLVAEIGSSVTRLLRRPWKSRGRKPFGARNIFVSLPHFLPSQERLAVRSDMLHQAKTIYISGIFCGCYSANLCFHRRDAGKLSSCPASACRRFGFVRRRCFCLKLQFSSKLSFASLECWS